MLGTRNSTTVVYSFEHCFGYFVVFHGLVQLNRADPLFSELGIAYLLDKHVHSDTFDSVQSMIEDGSHLLQDVAQLGHIVRLELLSLCNHFFGHLDYI